MPMKPPTRAEMLAALLECAEAGLALGRRSPGTYPPIRNRAMASFHAARDMVASAAMAPDDEQEG